MSDRRYRKLCRRRGCCPEVAVDPSADAAYAAVLVERGGGDRAPGEIRLTRDEALELIRAFDEVGLVDEARAEAKG